MKEYVRDYYDFGVKDTIPMHALELVKELETMMSDKTLPEKYFHTLYDAEQYILTPYYTNLEIQRAIMRVKNNKKKNKSAATRGKKIQEALDKRVVLE